MNLANISPTDFELQTGAGAANGRQLSAQAQLSVLKRRSGHTLKVEARVRTPLGLRENEPVRGHFLTFWRVSLSPNEPGLPTEFQKRRPRKGKRSGTTGPDG